MSEFKPRKIPTQTRARATFEAIIEASAQLLVEEGFHLMSTNGIAERAGVSIGSLYQYFPNKESIVVAVVERFADRQFKIMTDTLGTVIDRPLPVLVRALVDTIFEEKQAEPELNRVIVEQLPPLGQVDVMRDWTDRACEVIEMALIARQEEVDIDDPGMAAFLLVSALHGIMHGTLLDRPKLLDGDEIREQTTKLVLRYLRSEEKRK